MKKRYLLALIVALPYCGMAGGIRGTIKADDGTVLAFASIFVKQTGSGAATDLGGRYEIQLPPGRYDILFQYLGYESVARVVEIGADFIEINLTLKTQVLVLQTVTIKAAKEDPAYTIMRKAIAKAKYHIQQIDSYSAKVYIKGKGKLKDYPWLAKKALEKEGITKDRVFISESVSEIKYTRPNKFEEKVIAVYTSGKNNDASPNAYIFGSFYEPEIAETVSPLSPRAFSYYRFEYLGSFHDRHFEISKIKVTPRSKGDNVFEGVLFIVEDWWSIHSLDFHATKIGINFQVKQIYNPIEDKAWLPVSQQAAVTGKVFGFDFEGTYLATVKEYKIKMNPALPEEMIMVDEKIEKEEVKKIAKPTNAKSQQLKQRLESGKEISNKELKQLVKVYEKEEREKEKEPEVISETKYTVDSLAYKQDSVFWADIRPAPLDKEEERGYKKADSIAEVQSKRDEGDSLKPSKSKGFQIYDLVAGDRYKISKTADFQIHSLFGGFNTVEGMNLIYKMSFYKRWVKRDSTQKEKKPEVRRLEISPLFRYAFAREKLTGILKVDYRMPSGRLTLQGGQYVQQYNGDNPILPVVNTLTTLLLERNLMKLYEREFVELNYKKTIDGKYTFYTNWVWAKRHELSNTSTYTLINSNKEAYTANAPINRELASTSFAANTAFTGSVGIEARPWQKYRIRNGNKYRADTPSPLLTFHYKKGFDGPLSSEVNYDLVEAGVKQSFRLGIRGRLDMNLNAGKFLNAKKLYFMDYKHFLGNQTPIITTDPVGSFRLLDYYSYSTRDQYFSANAHYHFRKLLFTRIPKVRLFGISENVFVNYLATPSSKNYTELGYGLDGILRIFRLEAAASFQDGSYVATGFRLGIATSFSINFAD